ncbi:MAG TPA: discoidin domain-containing protein, partial [Polyangia bacterium]|nr:discoidin domain-containing protein [Polyangia bacterium]
GGAAGAAGAPADAGPPVNYCDRTHWKATASASYAMAPAGPPIQGIDGNLTTRWTSGRPQDGTDYYQVDFGGTVKLTKITLDDTGDNSAGDFPAGYQVYASTDGTTFSGTAFAMGSGTMSSTVISFPQQTVRAVKIKEIGSRTGIWWSIGEFQTVCSL